MSLQKKSRSRISLTQPMLLVRPNALSLTTRIDSSCVRYAWLLEDVALPFEQSELEIIYEQAQGLNLSDYAANLPTVTLSWLMNTLVTKQGGESIVSKIEILDVLEILKLIELVEAHLIHHGFTGERVFESDGKRIYVSEQMLKMLRPGEVNLENRISAICLRYHWIKQQFTLPVEVECFDRLLTINVRNKLLALNPKDIIEYYAHRVSNHFDLSALNNLTRWESVCLVDTLEDAVIAELNQC